LSTADILLHKYNGKLFHVCRYAGVKLPSPKLFCVWGTTSVLLAADRSKYQPLSEMRLMLLDKSAAAGPDNS